MSLDLSQLGNMTAFAPGFGNRTSEFNRDCAGNLTLCLNPDLCTLDTCDISLGQIFYIPTLAGNALFVAIFALCIIGQIVMAIKFKTWGFMIATICGMLLEIIGYIGRIMLNSNIFDSNAFLIYLVCLTIGPAFLSAAIYLCLARIVVVYGEEISRVRPRTYTIVFCSCDFIALLLQAVGGGIASASNDANTSQMGINIMLAGLSCQVASLFIFAVACTEFAIRLRSNPSGWNRSHAQLYDSALFKAFLFGLGLATLTIFVRSCFRVAELSGGFNGPLANNEPTFMILEGAMICIAVICLTCLHPGFCFRGVWAEANFNLRNKKGAHEKLLQSPPPGSDMPLDNMRNV